MYTQVEKYTPPLELHLALLYCDIFPTFFHGVFIFGLKR